MVAANTSTESSSTPASDKARRVTGSMAVRCARDANSGTTPPYTRWTSCERITSDFSDVESPEPSRIAADVSSHDVSIANTRVTGV